MGLEAQGTDRNNETGGHGLGGTLTKVKAKILSGILQAFSRTLRLSFGNYWTRDVWTAATTTENDNTPYHLVYPEMPADQWQTLANILNPSTELLKAGQEIPNGINIKFGAKNTKSPWKFEGVSVVFSDFDNTVAGTGGPIHDDVELVNGNLNLARFPKATIEYLQKQGYSIKLDDYGDKSNFKDLWMTTIKPTACNNTEGENCDRIVNLICANWQKLGIRSQPQGLTGDGLYDKLCEVTRNLNYNGLKVDNGLLKSLDTFDGPVAIVSNSGTTFVQSCIKACGNSLKDRFKAVVGSAGKKSTQEDKTVSYHGHAYDQLVKRANIPSNASIVMLGDSAPDIISFLKFSLKQFAQSSKNPEYQAPTHTVVLGADSLKDTFVAWQKTVEWVAENRSKIPENFRFNITFLNSFRDIQITSDNGIANSAFKSPEAISFDADKNGRSNT